MGWFSRGLSDKNKKEALILVRHLQTMLAYQQLAMETYNDAVASVVGDAPPGAEVSVRLYVNFSSPALVGEKVIPALEKKIEIIQLMEEKHKLMSEWATEEMSQAYQRMKSAIGTMLDRARLQHQGFTKWVQSPQMEVDTVSLDRPEVAALDSAISALNDLIKKVGLTSEEWLEINREAFNNVRDSLGLSPLDIEGFQSRYFSGMKGERVRFFDD